MIIACKGLGEALLEPLSSGWGCQHAAAKAVDKIFNVGMK